MHRIPDNDARPRVGESVLARIRLEREPHTRVNIVQG